MMFIVLVLLIVAGYVIKTIIKPKRYPPGPKWSPFIGCSTIVHNSAKRHGSQFKGLLELAKEHSTQLLGLKVGGELLVVVYGEKNVRQAFTEQVFEGRPDSFFLNLRCLGKKLGITFTDGPIWKIHRQFTLTQLKSVGFGKTVMEAEIQAEVRHIVEYLKKNQKPISPSSFVSQAVMNVLWKYVAGEKIKEDRWTYLQELFLKRSKAFSMAGGLLNQFPWCRFIIPNLSGYSLIKKLNRQISEIIEEAIEKHKNNAVEGKDFVYAFLENVASDDGTFTEEQLKVVCLDLLIAGSQTTSNLLEFAFVTLLRDKSIQNKICEEIDTVLGDNTACWLDSTNWKISTHAYFVFRFPRNIVILNADAGKYLQNDIIEPYTTVTTGMTLIYTSAFLLELQRYFPIAPLAGPRRVLHDTVMDGYLIPKDTTILISVGDIHFNSELWGDPHVFKPERFIDERGMLKNSEHMYPFGLGRRRCPGDTLARSFVFLALVGILQHYTLETVNGAVPSDEPDYGLIISPKPYKAQFKPRKNIKIN